MFKKIISISLLIIISWAISFASFTVIIDNKTELESANSLAIKKIINNHANDPENYNLTDNVLRQEIAAVARWVAKLDKKNRCDNIFKDLSDSKPNTWACRNVEVLVDNNLISRNENFRPEDKITKSETIAMLIKAIWFNYEYDVNNSKNWQQQVVEFATKNGVVELFTDYNTNATRWWVFQVADTTLRKDEEIRKQIKQWIYSWEANLIKED